MGLAVPPAIVIVNDNIATQTKAWLVRQLHINETLDGYTALLDRLTANPDYANLVKQMNLRIMVFVESFQELIPPDLRTIADVAIYVKNGLASVQKNNFGPPASTHNIKNLHWSNLCVRDIQFDVDGTQNPCGEVGTCSSTISCGCSTGYCCSCCNPSIPGACVDCGSCSYCSECWRCSSCGGAYTYSHTRPLVRVTCLTCGCNC